VCRLPVQGRALKIDMDKANITFVDDTFDRTNPSGEYLLDVSRVICDVYCLWGEMTLIDGG
jgi:hypothetical protein